MSLHVTSVWWSKITLTNVQLFFYCCDEIGRYCCKSLSLWWEKLFAFVYTINNHFKSILGPYKCQVTNIFWSFALNPIEGLQSRCPTPPPPAPKLRISQLTTPIGNFWLTPCTRVSSPNDNFSVTHHNISKLTWKNMGWYLSYHVCHIPQS